MCVAWLYVFWCNNAQQAVQRVFSECGCHQVGKTEHQQLVCCVSQQTNVSHLVVLAYSSDIFHPNWSYLVTISHFQRICQAWNFLRKCQLFYVFVRLLILQTISISLLQLQAFVSHFNAALNSHCDSPVLSLTHSRPFFFPHTATFVCVCPLTLVCVDFSLVLFLLSSSSSRCPRREAEFGRERLGGHSRHHRSFETVLPWASRAPGALRLLHRHCGDSQWVVSFTSSLTDLFLNVIKTVINMLCLNVTQCQRWELNPFRCQVYAPMVEKLIYFSKLINYIFK